MKKIMALLLAAVLCCGMLVGCGETEEKLPDKVESAPEEKEVEEEKPEEVKKEVEVEQEVEEPEETQKIGVKEYNVGEPFTVATEWGDYIVTITGMSETDWWERAYDNTDSKVVLLEYEIENVDFSNEMASGVIIDDTCFKVSDDEKYLLDTFSMRYDDIDSMAITEPGYKRKSSIPYISENGTTYYDIVFTRNSNDVAKVKINK